MLPLFVSVYILATLGIGFWASKKIKTSGDFMLAGKKLTTSFVGVTLFATWFGSNHIMGNPDYFVDNGFSSFFTLVVTGGLALAVVGAFYAKKLYRLDIVTVGDFFTYKYNKKLDTVISVILVLAYPLWIASQLVALAILFQAVINISFAAGLLLGASIVVLYTFIGGMWAVSYTDMLQSILILFGLIILMIFGLNEMESFSTLFKDKSTDFFSILPKNNLAGWSEYIAVILALFIGSIPGQEIYQRIFSAKDEKAAQNGLYMAAILIVVIPVIPAIIALTAAQLHPELAIMLSCKD
jgi:Na+/proline symporter